MRQGCFRLFCRCDTSHKFIPVWNHATDRSDKILSQRQWFSHVTRGDLLQQPVACASSLVAPCVHICDKSVQPMRKHQIVSRHVKFKLVYISSLAKLITCTEQVSYRSDLPQDQCRRGDLSPRCVAAICRIVCLGLKLRRSKELSFARERPNPSIWLDSRTRGIMGSYWSDVALFSMKRDRVTLSAPHADTTLGCHGRRVDC